MMNQREHVLMGWHPLHSMAAKVRRCCVTQTGVRGRARILSRTAGKGKEEVVLSSCFKHAQMRGLTYIWSAVIILLHWPDTGIQKALAWKTNAVLVIHLKDSRAE